MPDPLDLPTGDPTQDPLLDPATLPTGLILDQEHREDFLVSLPTTLPQFPTATPPHATTRQPPSATLLYPFLFAVCPDWTYGLQARGDCMAWSSCHTLDLLMALNIAMHHAPEQWRALTSIEAQYGFMRVEVYDTKPNWGGDGASPSAAAKAILKCGSLHRLNYAEQHIDLRTYDRTGGRSGQYGRWGVPNRLEPLAKPHTCETVTLVTSFWQAVQLLASGYPIANAAPNNPIPRSRDTQGFGTNHWHASHAMNYIGYRLGTRPGLLQANTGHGRHVVGPTWPDDMPATLAACSAWIDADEADRVLRQHWSFAYSNYLGFPERPLQLANLPTATLSPTAP